MTRRCTLVVLLVCVSLLAGCGSGNQARPERRPVPPVPPGPADFGVTVTPARPRVVVGSTLQFTSTGSDATWQVNGVPGGNSTVGTISATGLYTAPAIVPLDSVVAITPSSTPPSTASGYARVAVGAFAARFAYVSSASDNSIQIFTADGKTGMLQPASIFSLGSGKGPTALALSPNGNFLFSLNRLSNDISIFAINPATGGLTDAGSAPAPNGPYAMVFSSNGNYAYVSCDSASTIAAYAFTLSTGALTPLAGGSYAAGAGRIQGLAITPDGKSLYALNQDANQIVALAINQGDGSLTPVAGSPIAAQSGLSSIVVDDTTAYIGSDNGVEYYGRDGSSGLLTHIPSATTPTGGKSPVLFRNLSDGYLVGVNPASGGAVAINTWDGFGRSYTPLATATSPVAGGWLWNDASDNWVFALNRKADVSATTGSIGLYTLSFTNGLQGPVATIPTALHDPTGFVISP
jgi:6-phosphogluconolactonase (cycloisomerase 2 family)